MDPSDPLVVIADLFRRRAAGDPILRHTEIDASAERSAFRLKDEHSDPLIEPDLVSPDAELARCLPAPRIELLGVVERQDTNAIIANLELQLPLIFRHHR